MLIQIFLLKAATIHISKLTMDQMSNVKSDVRSVKSKSYQNTFTAFQLIVLVLCNFNVLIPLTKKKSIQVCY